MTLLILFGFVRRSAGLGLIGGVGLGIAYSVFALGLTGLPPIVWGFGAICGGIAGLITGVLNGALVAFVSTRYFKSSNNLPRYRTTILILSFGFWFFVSTLLLTLEIGLLFASTFSPSSAGSDLISDLINEAFFTSLPGFIAALYSLYISQQLIKWHLLTLGIVEKKSTTTPEIKYTF